MVDDVNRFKGSYWMGPTTSYISTLGVNLAYFFQFCQDIFSFPTHNALDLEI